LAFKNIGNKFKTSFFPHHSELWNNLPKNIQSSNLTDFKTFTKIELKPQKNKHFSKGNKYSNSLLTRIRVGRSYLNQHKFSIGHTDSPECLCHHREESPSHYFLDCFLYSPERQALFSLIEHYIPNFQNFSKQRKLDIILMCIYIENNDFLTTNISLTFAVQKFILQTKRFSEETTPMVICLIFMLYYAENYKIKVHIVTFVYTS
jgi:hypothetical protein